VPTVIGFRPLSCVLLVILAGLAVDQILQLKLCLDGLSMGNENFLIIL
jgi:hypothetical protein